MDDHESFEERLRAIADEVSRSMQRFSEVDLEELSRRYGVDANRAREFADAAGQWLSGRLSGVDPLFGQPDQGQQQPDPAQPDSSPGPHPLDLPDEQQGRALSALDSGRWTVRPGSNQLAGTGVGAAPAASDVVSELRARDWITADGTLTLAGRHALGRWCRTAGEPTSAPPPADAPPA